MIQENYGQEQGQKLCNFQRLLNISGFQDNSFLNPTVYITKYIYSHTQIQLVSVLWVFCVNGILLILVLPPDYKLYSLQHVFTAWPPLCSLNSLCTLGTEHLPSKDMIIYFLLCLFHGNFGNHEERKVFLKFSKVSSGQCYFINVESMYLFIRWSIFRFYIPSNFATIFILK